jgi:NADPH2:quinone reductase
VAGRGIDFVESIIDRSKGDTIIDYRKGDDAVIAGLKDALKGKKFQYAFDATSEHNSYTNIVAAGLEKDGHLTVVLPGKKYEGVPDTVRIHKLVSLWCKVLTGTTGPPCYHKRR